MIFTHNIILLLLFRVTNTWGHSQVDLASNNLNASDHGVKLLDDNDGYLTLFKNSLPGAEKVRIQMYYESHDLICAGFCKFIFAPIIETMDQYLDIQFYPYGKTRIRVHDGKWDFVCRHGPEECYANKLHACAMDQLQHTTALTFSTCLLSSPSFKLSDDESADRCGKRIDIDTEPIKECAKGTRGTELLLYYEEESEKANFSYVPHVLINGKMANVITANFKKQVCDAFTNPPPPCKND